MMTSAGQGRREGTLEPLNHFLCNPFPLSTIVHAACFVGNCKARRAYHATVSHFFCNLCDCFHSTHNVCVPATTLWFSKVCDELFLSTCTCTNTRQRQSAPEKLFLLKNLSKIQNNPNKTFSFSSGAWKLHSKIFQLKLSCEFQTRYQLLQTYTGIKFST